MPFLLPLQRRVFPHVPNGGVRGGFRGDKKLSALPFAMSYENLKLRALTVRDYLIKCQAMAMFASIWDIRDKEV